MPNMDRRHFLKLMGKGTAFLSAIAAGRPSYARHSERPPNFVIIFTDDQGYADAGCYGAEGFKTPNLDKMAAEGMRFTDFYVAQAVCSASRAALMTGCYSNRVSILGALGPHAEHGLHPQEETIADVLKKKGYATAVFGKWHLGHHPEFLPLNQGFDEYLGLPYSNDMWPIDYDNELAPEDSYKRRHPYLPLIEGNRVIRRLKEPQDQNILTTLYTERAVQFIERNHNKPFFLYLPHSMPHTPLGVSSKFRGKSEQGMYGDVIMEIDWSVGRIMETLGKHGLDDNTLVMFTSDNGPWLNFGNHAGSTGPLREGKGTSWEGGVRVPCIMRWPGRIPPGSVCREMAATMDILPTIAQFAGALLPERKIDGVDLSSLLQGEIQTSPRDHLFYYYGHQLQAVREGRWKLHFPHGYRSYEGVEPGMNGLNGPYAKGETGLELYDLENDIGETTDVSRQHPDIVKRLQALGEKARKALGDEDLEGDEIRPAGHIRKS